VRCLDMCLIPPRSFATTKVGFVVLRISCFMTAPSILISGATLFGIWYNREQ